jgi:hypothetical protein
MFWTQEDSDPFVEVIPVWACGTVQRRIRSDFFELVLNSNETEIQRIKRMSAPSVI